MSVTPDPLISPNLIIQTRVRSNKGSILSKIYMNERQELLLALPIVRSMYLYTPSNIPRFL